jgi:hypothetical protein
MKRSRFHEPSLVPLADMLTNTVGIVVFILIFTVLTAGGAVVAKRLPMERASDKKALWFLCTKGRVLPMPADRAFVDKFVEPLLKLKLKDQIQMFNDRTLEDKYFTVKGEADGFSFALTYNPKLSTGDTVDNIERANSALARTLAKYSSSKYFAYFYVADDSIDAFVKARLVTTQAGFGYGWAPAKHGQPIRLGLGSGGGGGPRPQY